jgi:hypothetical protein
MTSAGASHDGKPASSDPGQPVGGGPASQRPARGDEGAAPDAQASIATAVVAATAAPEARDGADAGTGAQASTGAGVKIKKDQQRNQQGTPKAKQGKPRRRGLRAVGRFFARIWRPAWVRHVVLLLVYIGAGIGATWPRFTYLADSKLPKTTDIASFVWGFYWIAHQVTHLGNPFFTRQMAAPAGIQLGFSTLMPLAGYVMTPVTLLWGPSAAFTVLSLLTPGLLCYAMYRAARLWLNQPGSIAAGAIFGLSPMVLWQNWYHLNIAIGLIFLPLTIEAAVRLRRSQKIAPAIWLGIALGGAMMTSQEGAAIAILLAAVLIIPWIIGKLVNDRAALRKALIPLGVGAVVALVVASPQLIAMAQQYLAGGAAVPSGTLAQNYTQFGVPLQTLFSPSPRLAYYGLGHFPSGYAFNAAPKGGTSVQPPEGLPGFGLVASALAVLGAIIAWRKRTTWWFVLLWLGCAVLALGTSITIGSACVVNLAEPGRLYGRTCQQYLPLASHIHWVFVTSSLVNAWEKVQVSNLMPYTWLVRIPWLSGLREADRFALVGMIGVAMLAGIVVQWVSQRRWWLAVPLLVVVVGLAVFETGWAGGTDGPPFTPTESMPTTMPYLDAPIQSDHSNSVVLDVPFGLRGGLSLIGSGISERSLLLATEDGHPRAVSYTAWVPKPTIKAIQAHAFYWYLMTSQNATKPPTTRQLDAAAADLKTLNIGWAIVWANLWRANHPQQRLDHVRAYLRDLGFRQFRVTCLVGTPPGTPFCGGRDLEKVRLLRYVPADAFKGSLHHHHHS